MELDCSFLQVNLLKFYITDFFDYPKFCFLLSGTAVLLGLGIHKYQDQIQELSSQVTQPIKNALQPLGPYLGEAKGKILDIKEKITSLPSAFSIAPESEK